jgi:hypothetical protein
MRRGSSLACDCDGREKNFQETNAMDNRAQRSVQIASAGDLKPTDVRVIAETGQTGHLNTAEPDATEADEAAEVKAWSERGRELSREYLTRTEADQKIVAAFRELRDKPKGVKKAFRDALNIENWEATPYRKVGENDFLHEPDTLKVFGKLTISQQYELAKAPPDVQRSIRDHFRTRPDDKRSKNALRKMRLAAKTKQTPEAGSATEEKPEAGSATNQKLEAGSAMKTALVEIRPSASSSFDTMEESDQAGFLAWLDAAPKSVEVIRLFEQG